MENIFVPADIVSAKQLIGERNQLKFYLWNNEQTQIWMFEWYYVKDLLWRG